MVPSAYWWALGKHKPKNIDAHAALNSLVKGLVGRQIELVAVEPFTNDIDVRFSGGHWVRTIVSNPEANENWYFRNCQSNRVVTGSSNGLRV